VVLSHTEAITTMLSLGVVADWTLRHFAKDLREARSAMIATKALTELAGRIIRANGDEVTFGGSPLGNAPVALIEAINLMTAPTDCACTDHERSTDRVCPSMAVACPPFVSSEAAIDCFRHHLLPGHPRGARRAVAAVRSAWAVRRVQSRGAAQPGARPKGRVRGQKTAR
jgi:hypothetical protein